MAIRFQDCFKIKLIFKYLAFYERLIIRLGQFRKTEKKWIPSTKNMLKERNNMLRVVRDNLNSRP